MLFRLRKIPFKFNRKFHIDQPNVNYIPSFGHVPPVQILTRPGLGSIDKATSLPDQFMGELGKSSFRKMIAEGREIMMISNAEAFRDYGLFSQRFINRFPDEHALPGLEVLGCGYDIFGTYADASSLKRFLFDVSKMSPSVKTVIDGVTYSHWPIVTFYPLSSSIRQTIAGQTAIEYSNNLRVKAGISGGWAGFHAEVETCFTESQRQSIYHAFTSVSDTTAMWSLHLNDIDNLRDYLTDEALNAIDHWDPDRLFNEFGLYFLTGIIMGGRLNYWSSVDMFKLDRRTDLSVSAEASFLSFASGEGSYENSSSFASFSQNSETSFATIGGDATKGGGSIKEHGSYLAWKETIRDRPAFIDFTRPTVKRPLTPIWELAVGVRRDELSKFGEAYAKRISDEWSNGSRIDPNSAKTSVTYVVTTFTGIESGAGTDSYIDMQLYGTDRLGTAQTLPKCPHDDGRPNHDKGDVDDIKYLGVHDLGELNKISFYHRSRGNDDGPAWLLDKVEVTCLESGKRWKGSFNGWLKDNHVDLELSPG